MEEGKKTCIACGRLLPLSAFPYNVGYADNHVTRCRECYNAYQAAYRREHLEKVKKGDEWPCKRCVKRSGKWCMRLRKSVTRITECAVRETARNGRYENVIEY